MNGYLILYSFYDETDAPTQKSISQKWMIPKQTVNTILKDYMQKGFIEAVSMPEVLWSRLSDFFAKEK